MLRLSKHFVHNWEKRVGRSPKAADITRLIRQAVRIQKGRQIYGRTGYIKTLTIYWHTDKGIIITVDHYTQTAVSVYSPAMMSGMRPIGECQGNC